MNPTEIPAGGAVAAGTPEPVYEWEVEKCYLKFRPELHGCYTLAQVAVKLQKDYRGWFVTVRTNQVELRRHPTTGVLLLIASAAQDVRMFGHGRAL
jgi:hypothetical protein